MHQYRSCRDLSKEAHQDQEGLLGQGVETRPGKTILVLRDRARLDGRQGYLNQGAFIVDPDPGCVLTYTYVVLSVFLVNLDGAKVGTERRGSGRAYSSSGWRLNS